MWLQKTSAKVLQVFTGHITETFTLREIARTLNMQVSLAHRAIQPLIINNILNRDKHKTLSLNYRKNHEVLAYAEYLKKEEFLNKPKNKDLALFTGEVLGKIKEDSFVFLLFGSAVTSTSPRDIDVLLIVNQLDKVEFHEQFLHNIASKYNLPIEPQVISFESVSEMLAKRDEMNLMNEILNKHVILYGAELFYRLLQKTR